MVLTSQGVSTGEYQMTKYDPPSDPYIDKIKKALLIAYIGNVGCTLSNEDCNDLTKYISRLEGDNEALKQRADWAVNHIKEADESMRVFTGDDAE
jgi:hypothetical protein